MQKMFIKNKKTLEHNNIFFIYYNKMQKYLLNLQKLWKKTVYSLNTYYNKMQKR